MQLFGNANPDSIKFFSLLNTSQHSGSCCHFQGALMPLSDTYENKCYASNKTQKV